MAQKKQGYQAGTNAKKLEEVFVIKMIAERTGWKWVDLFQSPTKTFKGAMW